jgi:hypothetical protein
MRRGGSGRDFGRVARAGPHFSLWRGLYLFFFKREGGVIASKLD